jgi:hypothetical protein
VIEAALRIGRTQPWMYETLAYSLQLAGRPGEEVERVILSSLDLTPLNIPTLLLTAANLVRFNQDAAALRLYKEASRFEPTAPEPYVLGLRLATKLRDADSVEWGATGIVSQVWTEDYAAIHQKAADAVANLETALRKEGQSDRADRLVQSFSTAKQRDLTIELTWVGSADLDLLVEEPAGSTASFEQRRTIGGGKFVFDGFGPKAERCRELYVCPLAMSGEYRVRVRRVRGDVVGDRAIVKITKYSGSLREKTETVTVHLTDRERIVRVELRHGRLLNPLPVSQPPVGRPRFAEGPGTAQAARERERWFHERQREGKREVANLKKARNAAAAGSTPVGYNPIIRMLNEGVRMDATAVVSADRRYVRLSLAPQFLAITDVFTFTFASGPGVAGGVGGGGLGGGLGGVGVGGGLGVPPR